MSDRPVLYLVDGHAVAYRQYFALPVQGFSTRSGEPTNATYGFTRILMDILEISKPDYLAVTFDEGLSGRETLYPDYKGTREKMPDELSIQMARIREMVRAFNIPVLTLADSEADDVIGTVSLQAEAKGVDVHIVTGDRDMLQLLSSHTRVQLPKRGSDDVVYDEAMFREQYGLEPNQLIDLKALMGDSSDNIPGVRGIGQKTATTLLQTYGTLDSIYENIAEQKGATLKKLQEGREMAYLSRELATIKRDMPIELNLSDCVAHDYEERQVDELFAQLEFGGLRERFRSMHQVTDFDPPAVEQQEVVIVRDEAALKKLVKVLQNADNIAFDTETTSVNQMSADLVGISFAVDTHTGYYIPVGHLGEDDGPLFGPAVAPGQLPLERVIEALRGPLTDPNIPKIAHNASYDLVMLRRYGIDVQPISFDTMIAAWMREPDSNNLSLKRFALTELNITMTEITELIGTGKNQRSMAVVPIDDVAPYAAADATVTMRAAEYLQPELAEMGVEELFRDLEMPLVPIIASMEQAGVLLDTGFLAQMSERLADDLAALEKRIYDLSEGYGPFNINSPKQLNDVLFGRLNLSVEGLKKTSHGRSTDVNALESLRDAHPIVGLILEYRELTKLKGTYVDALPQLVNEQTGRVHTSYNQTGTTTGRFSSSDPNLQNIPIRTELGREVRRAFIAPPGHILLAVDYSQIELRVMAHISEDATLIQAFHEGQDIHRATAAAVFSVDPDEVTYEQRSFAKRVNFGLMYGMGAFRLARDSDLTLAEAEGFINTYFERLPGVKRYIDSTKDFASTKYYVQTLMGRKRFFPNLRSGSSNQRAQGELRAAINMPIQGTAADILKLAMLRLYAALAERENAGRMILQVHDELVLEVPEKSLESTSALVVEIMEGAYALSVPLVANAQYGPNWREMQAIN